MTFCSEEQESNEIIYNVKKNNDSYDIKYLDGHVMTIPINDNSTLELEDIMINQAKDRNNDYSDLNKESIKNIIFWFLDCAFYNINKSSLFKFLFFIFAIINFYEFLNNRRKINELKKYRILLNNYKAIKNNPSLCKIIEFDSLYRKDKIDIFNIDEISLHEMKLIEKELKKVL